MDRSFTQVLVVDPGGTPRSWATREEAILYSAKGSVAWIPPQAVINKVYGGINAVTGNISEVEIASIVAIRGPMLAKVMQTAPITPKVSNKALFIRDHHRCAYCGEYFDFEDLTKDHIKPKGAGGKDTWMNLITACWSCNNKKADRTPEKANMPLKFKPYVPSAIEYLWFKNKALTPEQIEYLESFDSKHRRAA